MFLIQIQRYEVNKDMKYLRRYKGYLRRLNESNDNIDIMEEFVSYLRILDEWWAINHSLYQVGKGMDRDVYA